MWKRQDSDNNGGVGGFDPGESSNQYNEGTYPDGDDGDYSWWWSPTGMAVRYTIIILIFAAIALFFLGGYYHAQRRIRRGQPPLPYHAWMVRKAFRQPRYQNQSPYQPDPYRQHETYALQGQEPPLPPLPPPPYSAPPPAYAPPEGASKIMADQSYSFPNAQAHRVENPGASEQPLPPLPTARQ